MSEDNNIESAMVPAYKLFSVESKDKRPYQFRGKVVNLELGIPSNCIELYKAGASFPYLKLKKGAHVLFQNLSEQEVLKLINQNTVESDIKILAQLLTTPESKAIVATRLKELRKPN